MLHRGTCSHRLHHTKIGGYILLICDSGSMAFTNFFDYLSGSDVLEVGNNVYSDVLGASVQLQWLQYGSMLVIRRGNCPHGFREPKPEWLPDVFLSTAKRLTGPSMTTRAAFKSFF